MDNNYLGMDIGKEDRTVVLVQQEGKKTRVLTEREEIDLLLKRVDRLEQECSRMRQLFREWKDDRK